MKTLDMIMKYKQASAHPTEPPAKQQKTAAVVTSTPVTPKTKEVPKDPECSKAVKARLRAPVPLVQQSAVIARESHEEDNELAKFPDSTPQTKEVVDDASTKKASMDPQDPAKTTNIGSNLDPK